MNRRELLRTSAAATLAAAVPATLCGEEKVPEDFKATGKNVRQSIMAWTFNPMPMETLIPACAKMGIVAMEGIDTEYYPMMKDHGLAVSLCGSHPFAKGPVDPDNREMCVAKLREGIDLAVTWKSPSVITFTGMRKKGINDQQGSKNCVECWKEVIPYAEEKGINIVLEHLNSRDDTHPMKGHPGYFGDDVDHCIDLIKAVDSPRMKLLFDIYHVQVMNGDVIRRFRRYKDFIGHVHTAGCPGRGEIDDTQELNYPAIMRAIVATGYRGYTAQEFIPTRDDKLASLREAVKLCDV